MTGDLHREESARFAPDRVLDFAVSILTRLGVPADNAHLLADALVKADLQGIATHGISRLPIYVKRIQKHLIDPVTKGRVIHERAAVISIDGENGIGQVVASRAMDEAMRLARGAGIGAAGVRNSNHFGVAAYYCERAAANGLIGMAFTNSPKGIPPWGGRTAYFGTNPIAAAIPVADRSPVIVDLSTSVTARGNIILAAKRGEEIPSDWAIDEHGRPTTDPETALEGAVLPMAGPKGYALALLVEVLVAVLTGASFGPYVRSMYQDWSSGSDIGHMLLAIDPSAFLEPELFLRRMAAMVAEIEAVPPMPGTTGPRLPGDRRHGLQKERTSSGIPVPADLLADLNDLAGSVGASPLSAAL